MKFQDKTGLVRDEIFDSILRGEYGIGQKLPTERHISEQLNVSRVTVRRAYGELEDSGILQREQGKGTFVSEVKLQGNSEQIKHVALLTAIKDPFAMEFVESFQRELDKQDALCILKITEQDSIKEEQAAMQLVSKGVRNIVVWPSRKFHSDTFARLRLLGTNMVFFDRIIPGEYADYVGLDNDDAVCQLVNKAVTEGVQRLIFVSHSGLDADSDKQREIAFKKYCSKADKPFKIDYVPWHGDVKAAVEALSDDWFDCSADVAIVCVNDMVAVNVKAVVGDKFRVYGIDGLEQALAQNITTIKQPFTEMAEKAIELLYRQQKLAEKWSSKKVSIKGELIQPELM